MANDFPVQTKQLLNRILTRLNGEDRRRVRDALFSTEENNLPLQEFLFTTPGAGTWSKPQGVGTWIEVWGCGSGPGGGSGRKGAAGTQRAGGRVAPSAIPQLLGVFRASEFPNSISFTIAAGGLGGASQTTNSTDGNAGAAGADTTVVISGTSCVCTGGTTGGSGGQTATYVESTNLFSINSTIPFRLANNSREGGSISTANALVLAPVASQSALLTAQPEGANAVRLFPGGPFKLVGANPRGGAASLTGNAQKGGDGILGIAGAGGGAAVDSVGNSGAGGNGGDGFVYIAIY